MHSLKHLIYQVGSLCTYVPPNILAKSHLIHKINMVTNRRNISYGDETHDGSVFDLAWPGLARWTTLWKFP